MYLSRTGENYQTHRDNLLTVTLFHCKVTHMKDYNHLDKWIPAQIKKTGLPIFKVANRIGISRASIYAWMKDTTRPDSDTMLKFAQVIAGFSGEDSDKLFAEGLSQYTNRPEGRKSGKDWAPQATRVRARKGSK